MSFHVFVMMGWAVLLIGVGLEWFIDLQYPAPVGFTGTTLEFVRAGMYTSALVWGVMLLLSAVHEEWMQL